MTTNAHVTLLLCSQKSTAISDKPVAKSTQLVQIYNGFHGGF